MPSVFSIRIRHQREFCMISKFCHNTIKTKRNLRLARVKADLSIISLASMMNVTPKVISDLESKRDYGSFINYHLLCKIADSLDLSLDDLKDTS
jgi:transcriptional regulator with XRE-family HTH domain